MSLCNRDLCRPATGVSRPGPFSSIARAYPHLPASRIRQLVRGIVRRARDATNSDPAPFRNAPQLLDFPIALGHQRFRSTGALRACAPHGLRDVRNPLGDNDDLCTDDEIVNAIREPSKKCPPNRPINLLTCEGIDFNSREARTKRGLECLGQPLSLLQVPTIDFTNISLCGQGEPNLHLCSSRVSRNSSHVRTSSGCAL